MDKHEESRESTFPLLGGAGLDDLTTEKLFLFEDEEEAPLVTLRGE